MTKNKIFKYLKTKGLKYVYYAIAALIPSMLGYLSLGTCGFLVGLVGGAAISILIRRTVIWTQSEYNKTA